MPSLTFTESPMLNAIAFFLSETNLSNLLASISFVIMLQEHAIGKPKSRFGQILRSVTLAVENFIWSDTIPLSIAIYAEKLNNRKKRIFEWE
jgi:hypothetical protein